MAVETLTGIPASFVAGDTLIFTENFSDFPATGWTAALVLNLNGTASTYAGTADGASFLFTLTAAQSVALAPGLYDYAIHVTETATSQRATAKSGTIGVEWDVATSIGQSTAQAILAALESTIQKLAGGTNSSVSFNGQTYTKKDLDMLTKARAYWKSEALREQAALRGTQGNSRIGIQFASPYSQFPPFPSTTR